MKKVIRLFSALALNIVMGAVLATALGIEAVYGITAAVVISALAGSFMPAGSLCAGLLTELWTGKVVQQLNKKADGTFLQDIPDFSGNVENDVIHLVGEQGFPEVLINNTTYPIPNQQITDADIALSLAKYQTKVTPVTDDELHAISYDKMGSITRRHADAIAMNKFQKAIHAIGPAKTADKTPVLFTSGSEDADKRIMLRREDIISLKRQFDGMEVPDEGRILVLSADHVNDLLLNDQKFMDQYYNYQTGTISGMMYGFKVYSYVGNPVYDQSGNKADFGTLPATGTSYRASIAFYNNYIFKAQGSTKMYYRDAAINPEYQQSVLNFRHYYLVMPLKQEALGAIVSKVGA